jgi:outer membrane protein OmpA-like peptidoglycan-associated protein
MTTYIRRGAMLTLALGAGFSLLMSTGCATKKYVRNQTEPIVEHTKQLDAKTAKNQQDIQSVDQRAQQGIDEAHGAADKAQHAADAASQQAATAQQGVTQLNGVVANIGNYKQVATATVNFGFGKYELTSTEKQKLDTFASQIGNTQGYILALTGGTDSIGPKAYNFHLSQERAQAVERYLIAHYQIPPYKFYVIGMGKEDAVASNHTRTGRAENRRVTIQLMTDRGDGGQMASSDSSSTQQR